MPIKFIDVTKVPPTVPHLRRVEVSRAAPPLVGGVVVLQSQGEAVLLTPQLLASSVSDLLTAGLAVTFLSPPSLLTRAAPRELSSESRPENSWRPPSGTGAPVARRE